jgi:hypothetical protein
MLMQAVVLAGSGLLSQQAPDLAEYRQVLDAAFRHSERRPEKTHYSFVMRFSPSRGTESQIAVHCFDNDRADVTRYSVEGTSAWSALMERRPNEDVTTVLRRVRVSTITTSVTVRLVDEWLYSLIEALDKSADELASSERQFRTDGTSQITLDGGSYDLWLYHGVSDLHWHFLDAEIQPNRVTGNLPLAHWMNATRITVSEIAK